MPDILVNHTGKNLYSVNGIRFMPGVNKVDKEAFEKAKKDHPLVRHRLLKGVLVEVPLPEAATKTGKAKAAKDDGDGNPGGEDLLATLKGFEPDEAVALVEQTVDRELLATWLKAERRKDVKAALKKRLDETDPEKHQNDPEDGDDPEE